jgi:lysophospholipase L1-like esterase
LSSVEKKTLHLSRGKKICFALLLVLLPIIFVLGTGEILVRIFYPQRLIGIMYSDDAAFGFWNQPNLRNKQFQSEVNCPYYRVNTDAKGYRSTRLAPGKKPVGVRRIVVLGDSYTFGVGVENDETIPAQLETLLNAANRGQRYEVINAGSPGWGTENELAFWMARRDELQPDLLILLFYRNDLLDNMRHLVYDCGSDGKPVYAPKQNLSRAKRAARCIPFYGFLSEHSHLVNLVRKLLVARLTKTGAYRLDIAPVPAVAAATSLTSSTLTQTPNGVAIPPPMQLQLELYASLMHAFMQNAQSTQTPLLLALLPDATDCVAEPRLPFSAVVPLVKQWETDERLRALNLQPPFYQAHEHGESLYITGDGHFNPAGCRLAAQELARVVQNIWGETHDLKK